MSRYFIDQSSQQPQYIRIIVFLINTFGFADIEKWLAVWE